jgi:hypothetical protein
MLRNDIETEETGNGERLLARIHTQFLIRNCIAMSKMGGGDFVRGLVLTAISDASVRHLRHYAPESRKLAGLKTIPTNDSRLPISVSALARSLGMPYETTRRHVAKLIEMGACVRVPDQGVIVPAEWLERNTDVTAKVYASLRTMLNIMHSAGFDVDGMARSPAPGVTPKKDGTTAANRSSLQDQTLRPATPVRTTGKTPSEGNRDRRLA